jgi:hypothetical protein
VIRPHLSVDWLSMSAAPQPSLFDPLPVGHLEAQLDQWVDAFPVEAIRQHLEDLERRKGDIEKAMESLNRRLQYWSAMRAHHAGQGDKTPKPSKRNAVLNLIERDPGREFALKEIWAVLVEDGIVEDTPKARHALEMTVLNMRKRGEIARVRKGFYKLVTPTDPHRQGGDA